MKMSKFLHFANDDIGLEDIQNCSLFSLFSDICKSFPGSSGQTLLVWFGVITTLVMTKKAPFSAGGTWKDNFYQNINSRISKYFLLLIHYHVVCLVPDALVHVVPGGGYLCPGLLRQHRPEKVKDNSHEVTCLFFELGLGLISKDT